MYNKKNARPSRDKNKRKQQGHQGGQSKKRKFTGDDIDINRFINKAEVKENTEVFTPRYSFSDLKIQEVLKQSIAKRGFSKPTPIQDQTIPLILEGKDVVGLANTGTGKTAAFLIPMINKILKNPQEKLLIVVPTRELAIQIQEEFFEFCKKMSIHSVVVVGGANIQGQIRQLKSRHNVIIGTPGRLKDLIGRKKINLAQFKNVVLDEADRMLDMGFINDMKWMLSLVDKNRQMMLFSATFSPEVKKLSDQFLNNHQQVAIKSRETASQIDQDIITITAQMDKVDTLYKLLVKDDFEKVLIFTRTKHGADKLSKKLRQRGLASEAIHGDKSHNRRQKALGMFKEKVVDVLIATDVASRGLDIPNVSHVINYDVPSTYDDYIHRIGRTGRADKKGTALTFIG